MIAIVDGDSILWSLCFIADKEGWEEKDLYSEIDRYVINILTEVDAKRYGFYIAGAFNFRKRIDPQYKAQRVNKPRPTMLKEAQDYVVKQWGAVKSHGCEADDLVSIVAHAIRRGNRGFKYVICSIDKDLFQVPGLHYNFKTKVFKTVTPLDAQTSFCIQMLSGDSTDNIKGLPGKTENAIARFGLNKRKGVGTKTAENIISQIRPKDRLKEIAGLYMDFHGNKGMNLYTRTYATVKMLTEAPPGFNPKSTIRVFRKASNKFAYVSRPNHKQLNGKVED